MASMRSIVWNLTIGEDGITANAVHFFRVVVGANPYQSEKTPCKARRIFVGTGVLDCPFCAKQNRMDQRLDGPKNANEDAFGK